MSEQLEINPYSYTLTYKGKEVIEQTEPFVCSEGKEMLAWNDDNIVLHVRVFALLDKPILDGFRVIGRNCFYKHCGEYPKEKPRKLSVKEIVIWLIKGNGFLLDTESGVIYTSFCFSTSHENEPIADGYKIRHLESEDWLEPTIDNI